MITSQADILKELEKPLQNKILYFKNKNHRKKNNQDPPPHFHIVIPTNDGQYILLVFFSKQVTKTKSRYEGNKKATDCLEYVSIEKFEFLTENQSVINCNDPIYCTKEELASIINGKLSIKKTNIPGDFLNNLKIKIRKSPLVKKALKKKIV